MDRKGQALVEFVLILPIFILILFSLVDFGMILSKKSELENTSTDIVSMIRNGKDISSIKSTYPNIVIDISNEEENTIITIYEDVDVITPGLNLVFGNPYRVKVERTVPNAQQ